MIISFILLILILISSYFVNSKEHLISTIPGGQKITYEGDAIRYTCGDTNQVIHNEQGGVIQPSPTLDASIKLNPEDNEGDVHYSDGTANKIQCKCKNGFSIDPADSTKCICPAGNYITNGNCVGCPTGKYQSATGQSSCNPPPPGKHVNSTATGFTDCPAGTYAPPLTVGSAFGHATTSCWSCPVGRYQDNTGQTSCKSPVAGKRASTDKREEIDCELGTWSTNKAPREHCAKPPAGKYANGGEFQNCAAGTWAAANNVVRTACANPGVGKYANTSTTEKDCAAGTWASGNTTPRTSCTSASTGHYVAAWWSTGRWYQDACPAGTFQPWRGQSSCINCPAGTWQDATGQTSCKNASIGHVVPYAGRWYQDSCHKVWGATKYQDNVGQSSCKTYTEQDRTYSSAGNTGAWGNDSPGTGHARSMLDSDQAWSSFHNGPAYYGENTWIKIDLKYSRWVRGVVTQGRKAYDQWVKKYKVKYSVDNHLWSDAADTNGSTEHTGNTDQNTKVESVFNAPILARYIRIIPYETHNHSSMRVGVLFPQ